MKTPLPMHKGPGTNDPLSEHPELQQDIHECREKRADMCYSQSQYTSIARACSARFPGLLLRVLRFSRSYREGSSNYSILSFAWSADEILRHKLLTAEQLPQLPKRLFYGGPDDDLVSSVRRSRRGWMHVSVRTHEHLDPSHPLEMFRPSIIRAAAPFDPAEAVKWKGSLMSSAQSFLGVIESFADGKAASDCSYRLCLADGEKLRLAVQRAEREITKLLSEARIDNDSKPQLRLISVGAQP